MAIFFTTFVMLQFWNLFNARCLGQTRSALQGLTANVSFLGIAAAIFVGQVAIVTWGGELFRTSPLSLVGVAGHFSSSDIDRALIGELLRWIQRSQSPAA
ncbi:MAG: cation transporting ATPase C-terminal domain-containing protein [Pirellulaceae bacterium]